MKTIPLKRLSVWLNLAIDELLAENRRVKIAAEKIRDSGQERSFLHAPPRALEPFHAGRVNEKTTRLKQGESDD